MFELCRERLSSSLSQRCHAVRRQRWQVRLIITFALGSERSSVDNRDDPRYLNVPDMLEKKIRDLTTRILELEQALSSSHAQHSQATHPLLKNEQLGIVATEEDDDMADDSFDMPEECVFKHSNSPKWIMVRTQPISRQVLY
jgi:hypothetical protein